MKTFKNYIIEKSFSQSDIPESFWVVFDLEEMVDELKTGKVKGLKGISSSSEIEFAFLGVARDAMLQMDSESLLKQNKITRIMYDNPHYLVSNNMWGLRRLYNARQKIWMDQVFGNLFEQIQKIMPSYNKQLAYDMSYYGFRNVDYDWSKKTNPKLKVNNIKDLAKVVKKYIETIFSEKTGIPYDVSLNTMQGILFKSIKVVGETYKDENEWVIKDDILTVPKGSTLYVLTKEPDFVNDKVYDVVANNMDQSSMDMFFVFKENDINDKYIKDISLYQRLVKNDIMINKLGKRFKIVKYDLDDFKQKQSEFWKKGSQ